MAWTELAYAIRRLRNTPTFTGAATVTLALAIGATASVFAVVDAALLKPFPFREPGRVLVVMEKNEGLDLPLFSVSPKDYLDWRAHNRSLTTLSAVRGKYATVSGFDEPERVIDLEVTPDYFPTLGMAPILGRVLATDSAGPAEAVISYSYWQSRFAGARSTLGRTITIDEFPYTIVGITPKAWPGGAQLWTRLSFHTEQLTHWGKVLTLYGRLLPNISAVAAQRDLDRLARSWPLLDPGPGAKGWSAVTTPVLDQWLGDVRPALTALLAAAACVLLIGAANLANLFVVRGLARERETAVRSALGATRARLARELLVEAATLGVAGGTLGIVAAVVGVRILRGLASPDWLPRVDQVSVDARVVAVCAIASVATVLVFGVVPAWHTSFGNLVDVLKEGGGGTGTSRRRVLQEGLVVLQMVVALVLLTGAGLLVKTFVRAVRTDLEFRPDGVIAAQLPLPANRDSTPERQFAFASHVLEELVAQPGVEAASVASGIPTEGAATYGFVIVGDPPAAPGQGQMATALASFVTPDYFRTLEIPFRRGRGILPTDDSRGTKVAVVDDLLAQRYFAGRDPIGRRITFGGPDSIEIVGVCATVREPGSEDAQQRPGMYFPLAQARFPQPVLYLAVRSAADTRVIARAIRRAVSDVDRTVPVSDLKTMNERLTESIDVTRFSTFLASLFAVVALALGGVGIYSTVAYIVVQRRREIGVRIALGARPTHVMGHVLGRIVVLAGLSIRARGAGGVDAVAHPGESVGRREPTRPRGVSECCCSLRPCGVCRRLHPGTPHDARQSRDGAELDLAARTRSGGYAAEKTELPCKARSDDAQSDRTLPDLAHRQCPRGISRPRQRGMACYVAYA